MPVQRVLTSSFDAEDHIVVKTINDLASVPEQEGIVIVLGANNALDGGGGTFYYVDSTDRSTADSKMVFDVTGTGTGDGCWHRVTNNMLGSLAWFGSDDRHTNNLLASHGVQGLIVHITEPVKGGFFKFNQGAVANHDGINNFNGWERINDGNFVSDINLNGNKITNVKRGVGNKDGVNLEQVHELVASGEYVGIVPLYSPRYYGDGVTAVYQTKASGTSADPTLLVPASFEVTVNGLKLRPSTDYKINIATGDLEFVTASIPKTGDKIDIVWFSPIIAVDYGNNLPVTATVTNTTNSLEDWFGKNGKDILVQPTSYTKGRTLGEIYQSVQYWFDSLTDVFANSAYLEDGMVIGIAYDGGNSIVSYGEYKLITKTRADALGLGYGTGSANFLVADRGLVAIHQQLQPAVLDGVEYDLIPGDPVIDFPMPLTSGHVFLVGDSVDQGRLQAGKDYTLSNNGTRLTLTNTYPAGTKLVYNFLSALSNTEVEVKVNGVSLGTTAEINFVGDYAGIVNGAQIDIYNPAPTLTLPTFSLSPTFIVKGQVLSNLTINWSFNNSDADPDNFALSRNGSNILTDASLRTMTYSGTIAAGDQYRIIASSSFGSVNKTKVLREINYIYTGVSTNIALDETALPGLTTVESLSIPKDFTINGSTGTYWYLCIPVSYLPAGKTGDDIKVKDKDSGFAIPVSNSTKTLINTFSVSEQYVVVQSDNAIANTVNVEVSI